MFFTVHIRYKAGIRRPPDQARANSTHGWLYLCHRGRLSPHHELVAVLSESERVAAALLLEPLWYPKITLVKGGMLLAGREMLDSVYSQHQRWWCVPGGRPPPPPSS